MKHLKLFNESIKEDYKYNIGDLVILNLKKIRYNNKKFNWHSEPIDTTALITSKFTEKGDYENYYNYYIEFYNGIDQKFKIVSDSDIDRLATPEEIDDFKAKSNQLKYNL